MRPTVFRISSNSRRMPFHEAKFKKNKIAGWVIQSNSVRISVFMKTGEKISVFAKAWIDISK